MNRPASSRHYWAGFCKQVSLILAACLPLLLPFDAARNVDMQGAILIIAGGFAWCALLLSGFKPVRELGWTVSGLLGLFVSCCLVSSLVNAHLGYNLWGAPYLRLGSAGLLACMGIGLLLRTVEVRRLVSSLYLIILGLAVISPFYSYLHFHSLGRLGGVFMQADVMGCMAGAGLLLGLGMFEFYPRRQRWLLLGEALLTMALLLTQTRAVLILVVGLGLMYAWRELPGPKRRLLLYGAGVLLLAGGLYLFGPTRVTSTTYASASVSYRTDLQTAGLHAADRKPWFGYGPGNLADALNCQTLHYRPLQTTCRQGYFFNSSHNIFLDRVLAIGWAGGLAFLLFVIAALASGWRTGERPRAIVYAALLIACYYLTNVTSVTLELLFWILLFNMGPSRRPHEE